MEKKNKLASVDADAECQNEDGEDAKEEDGVNKDSLSVGLEAAKLNVPGAPRKLDY
ncbi:conserved hypothetical protein [Ricinus communis]|uniref:Uncharacterized protein n=1 Tax=Ricinus communis TaxID=3988 RepID=B9RAE0_RICCO|nr:conserved hypothetical protein [Ricinus communis]